MIRSNVSTNYSFVKVGEKRNECGERYDAGNRSVLYKNRRVTNGNEDAREDSQTRKQVYVVDLSTEDPMSKFIKPESEDG